MDYKTFQQSVIDQYGDFYTKQVDVFFTQAVAFAVEGKFEDAIKVANYALYISEFSNIGYEILYLIGMLCEAYLDNNQPGMANDFFNLGMKIIEDGSDSYHSDLDQFLDLKIFIDEALKEKENMVK